MIIRELINLLSLEVNEESFEEGERRVLDVEEALAFLAAAGAAAALAVASLVDHVQHVTRSAELLGVGTDILQEWGYAAVAAGADVDNFAESLLDLEDKMDDAASGGKEYQELFARLGVTLKDDEGKLKSLEAFLPEVADAFEKMADGTERSGIASRLLGETGAKTLLPMFAKGAAGIQEMAAEARALGVVLDEKVLRDTMAFRAEWGRTTATLQSMVHGIGGALLPGIQDLLVSLRAWIRENRALIASGFEGGMRLFAAAARITVQALAPLLSLVVFLARDLGGARLAMYGLLLALTIYTGNAVRAAVGSTMGFIAAMVSKIAVTRTYTDLLGRTTTRLELLTLAEAKAAVVGAAAPYAIAAAWGALIIILGLLLEDLYTFSQGGDSLLGRWGVAIGRLLAVKGDDSALVVFLKWLGKLLFDTQGAAEMTGRFLRRVFGGMGASIRGFIQELSAFWQAVGTGQWAQAGSLFMDMLGPFGTWLEWMGGLFGKVREVVDWLLGSNLERAAALVGAVSGALRGDGSAVLRSMLDATGALGDFAGERFRVGVGDNVATLNDWAGRAASPARVLSEGASSSVRNSSSNLVMAPTQQNTNTFYVGPGVQPQAVGAAVRTAQETSWEDYLRDAQVGLKGGM